MDGRKLRRFIKKKTQNSLKFFVVQDVIGGTINFFTFLPVTSQNERVV